MRRNVGRDATAVAYHPSSRTPPEHMTRALVTGSTVSHLVRPEAII
jgi:hypothetical protein